MSKERISELEDKLTTYRDAYYNGEPLVEDDVYDALEDELRRLDPDNDLLTSVGAAPSGKTKWSKRKHDMPMTSLNKVNDASQMKAWCQKAVAASACPGLSSDYIGPFSWSEKLDGISIALYYEDGELQSAITRGDGFVGEDIMANVVMMRGVERTLSRPFTGALRGEIVLTHDMWKTHFPDYSNPRNAAAGIAKRETRSDAQDCQYLTVKFYDVYSRSTEFDNDEEKFFFLKTELGLKVPNHGFGRGPKGLEELYEEYEDSLREELNYDIDGLVVRLQDREYFRKAGERGGNPFGAVALKFAAEGAVTRLRNVVWQTGDTGRITPVAEFDEVELAGAKVRRASLYNVSYIQDLNLNVGDDIMVVRANDVIPRVEKVVTKLEGGCLSAPTRCPECHSKTQRDGEYIVCTNDKCEATTTGRVKQWIDSLGILDWGDFIIEKVVESGLVESVPDLYELDVTDLEGLQKSNGAIVGKKTADNLLDRLHSKTEVTLDVFIGGLGIDGIRNRTVQKMMEAGYDSLDKLHKASDSELTRVDGIGQTTAETFVLGMFKRSTLIARLLKHVSIKKRKGNLKGVVICLTGAMSKPRASIKRDIQDAGGIVKGMSKKVDYLVAADPTTNSGKAKKARKYGTPIIDENELYKMM